MFWLLLSSLALADLPERPDAPDPIAGQCAKNIALNKGRPQLKPKPWIDRPSTQRWLGRIETIVIVGIVTAGLGATYHYSAGAGK